MENDFLGRSSGKIPRATNGRSEKVILFLIPDGLFHTVIRVPFLQSHLFYQFRALRPIFGKWD